MSGINPCAIHRKLLDEYHRLLTNYTNETIELSNSIGIDRAEAETLRLRSKCIETREALRTHDIAHGCQPLPDAFSRRKRPSEQTGVNSDQKIRHA